MNRRKANLRIAVLAIFFCVACFVFALRLFSLQVVDREKFRPTTRAYAMSKETVIRAVRGNLCDRNGKILVGNKPVYDLRLDYYTLPAAVSKENKAILDIVAICKEYGQTVRYVGNFPYEGTYPDLVRISGEDEDRAREKIIDRYGWSKDISDEKFIKKIADRYDLLDNSGRLKVTPDDAMTIMKMRWSMICDGFYNTGYYTLAEGIDKDLIIGLGESELVGWNIDTTTVRTYEYPGYASHILGTVGRIFAEDWDKYKDKGYSMDAKVGISGCEAAFEEYLRGKDGVLITEYDAYGNVTDEYVKEEPVAGYDVYLTIDIDLQKAAEDSLEYTVGYIRSIATGNLTGEDASAGAFTMVEVNTGKVLAIASYPSYDLTNYNDYYKILSESDNTPLLNRAINGIYAPGSTFKVGMSFAALDTGTITPETIIDTKGQYTYYSGYQPRCWYYISTGGTAWHGKINVSEALRVSCNCFFYEVGRLLGIDTMNKYCTLYGLGQPTGIEIGGAVGVLAGPEERLAGNLAAWEPTDTIVAAIGQSDNLFSPLQINMYISSIANGGKRYKATLLSSVNEYYTGREIFSNDGAVLMSSYSMSEENRQVLLKSMQSVIDTSTFLEYNFRKVGVHVAGKSGTAQIGTKTSENGVFVAVAPTENPIVAAACVIEHGHSGSYSALPIAETFAEYFK